jgi:1-acyl-sn-glycerol-3-phosphate acyltransferase
MKKAFAKWLLNLLGWKVNGGIPKEIRKSVVIAAPHTSNWDLLYTILTFYVLEVPLKFTIKKELDKPVIGAILKSFGAIFIDRSPKKAGLRRRSMVDAMAELFDSNEELFIVVTPEGTRSYAPKWKTGFYWVATKAQVPITMGYIDYKHKQTGIGPIFQPTGDVDHELQEIMDFYKSKTGKFPEKGVL